MNDDKIKEINVKIEKAKGEGMNQTELISGIDLVREQISISAGNKISFEQNEIAINGYALECRIYAEDPENNFLPSTGKILHYKEPNGIGVRVDSGFAVDSEISIHYDPMIAKLICWDRDRNKVILRMNRALDEFQIAGITTNIKFLNYILNTDEFKSGNYDINFIDNLNYHSTQADKLSDNKNEYEIAASVLAALIKTIKKSVLKKNASLKNNNWWEQNYE
jgi:acetyl-CoA carboxylase biotin carboxylase subunit